MYPSAHCQHAPWVAEEFRKPNPFPLFVDSSYGLFAACEGAFGSATDASFAIGYRAEDASAACRKKPSKVAAVCPQESHRCKLASGEIRRGSPIVRNLTRREGCSIDVDRQVRCRTFLRVLLFRSVRSPFCESSCCFRNALASGVA